MTAAATMNSKTTATESDVDKMDPPMKRPKLCLSALTPLFAIYVPELSNITKIEKAQILRAKGSVTFRKKRLPETFEIEVWYTGTRISS